MKKQLLIYGDVVPLNRLVHKNTSIKSGSSYEFSRQVNSVPLTAVEFDSAALEYPIVFAGTDENFVPVALLGIQSQENVMLDSAGRLEATYIPAFLRRYPFVFSSDDQGENFTLCIDQSFEGCNEDGRGERLFDSEGEKTQYLDSVLAFLKQYQAHFKRTELFCQRLKEYDLFEAMSAQLSPEKGPAMTLSGFYGVSRERLKKLPNDQLAALLQVDELDLIYHHFHSLKNFSTLVSLSASRVDSALELDTASINKAMRNSEDRSVLEPEVAY